jgi:tRNA dimethylallyltransferase
VTAAQHLALVGTTASGKSALALALARRHPDIELVSIDSMQVYRGMDIGTAKPSAAERAEVPHHLIDLVDPGDEFTVRDFQSAFGDALALVERRGHRALLVGGTGLYLRAVVDGLTIPGTFPDARRTLDAQPTEILHDRLRTLDPVGASRMTTSNRRRIVRALEVTIGSGRPFSSFGPGLETYPPTPFRLIGITLPPEVVGRRIAERYQRQLANGFLDEVRRLRASPVGLSRTASQALGYKELAEHLRGERTLDDAVETAVLRTRRFARRQRAWFRRDPRIEWLSASSDPDELLSPLTQIVSGAGPVTGTLGGTCG